MIRANVPRLVDTLQWLARGVALEGCRCRVTRMPSRKAGTGRRAITLPPYWVVELDHPELHGTAYLHPEGFYLSSDQMALRTTAGGGRRTVPDWERLVVVPGFPQ